MPSLKGKFFGEKKEKDDRVSYTAEEINEI